MILNKLKSLLSGILDFLFCDVEELVHFICSQEALPTPLPPHDEELYISKLGTAEHDLARAKLIEHNLRLVVYISKKFTNTNVELDDLVSIGIIGLIKAVGSYKSDKNIKLATYASRCIENEILMHLRKVSRTIGNISLEEPLSRDSDGSEMMLQDILADTGDSPETEVEKDSDRRFIRHAVSRLAPRERKIIELRYGLDGEDEFTQKEVADLLGISQSYISRLEKRILSRLKTSVLE